MKRINKPSGLIRYESEKGIQQGQEAVFNARTIAYSFVLTVLLMVIAILFTLRTDVEATIVRAPGTLFQEYGPDKYANIYKIQLVNKTRNTLPIDMKINSEMGEVVLLGRPIIVEAGKVSETDFMLLFLRTSYIRAAIKLR